MKILGVDPGKNGAVALLTPAGLQVADIPVFHTKPPVVDVHDLSRLIASLDPDVCWLEDVSSMPGDGVVAAHNFGRVTGAIEAVVRLNGGRIEKVRPHVWKKEMKLKGGPVGKEQARLRACELWAANAADFARKMDADRAEAALLAEYGRLQAQKEMFS